MSSPPVVSPQVVASAERWGSGARRLPALAGLAMALAFVPLPAAASDRLVPERLRAEYLVDPIGLATSTPRLSWELRARGTGARPTAYEVVVASAVGLLTPERADLWATGKRDGLAGPSATAIVDVIYAGQPLRSRQAALWRVRVWDEAGHASSWSPPARFEIGLLAPGDWQARWIAAHPELPPAPALPPRSAPDAAPPVPPPSPPPPPAPLLRRAFVVRAPVQRARLYVSGLGYHEVVLNGRKVGDRVLDPGFTNYDTRVLYVTHDVTKALRTGGNVVGVVLGNGFFNQHARDIWHFEQAPWRATPRVLAQLEIAYADGSSERFVSDESWRWHDGPIRFDGVRNGETYDARNELAGWAAPGMTAADWPPVTVVAGPKGALVAQQHPGIRVIETRKLKRLKEVSPGVVIFDAGQNVSGWVHLKARAPAGHELTFTYGERLGPDGTVDQKDLAGYVFEKGFQTDRYRFAGRAAPETWSPRFTYHGFRYVQVAGWLPSFGSDSLAVEVVHTDFRPIAELSLEQPSLQAIHAATLWSYRNNFVGIPTDCPHREKNGWLADAHLAIGVALYNFDNVAATISWCRDLRDAQSARGDLPGIVPTPGWGYQDSSGPSWESALFLIPWALYEHTGDRRLLEDSFAAWQRYLDYLAGRAKDDLVDIRLSDWMPWKTRTPAVVTSTAHYAHDVALAARAARVLGRTDEAARYDAWFARVRDSFRRAFVDSASGKVAGDQQTAMAVALFFDLLRDDEKPRVAARLADAIRRNDFHLDTGVLGAHFALDALAGNGYPDVAYALATQTTEPSWGAWIARGATTLWEDWRGTGSLDHVYFGDIDAWFFRTLVGIRPDAEAPGFAHILARPYFAPGLARAQARVHTVRGEVAAGWSPASAGQRRYWLQVPAASRATLTLPKGSRPVRGQPLASAVTGNELVTYELGSGRQEFLVPAAP